MNNFLHKAYQKYLFKRNRLRIFKLKFLGARVGKGVTAYGRFTVVNIPKLIIGDNTKINEGVHINCRNNVVIGKNVHISSNVQIHTGKLEIDKLIRIHTDEPIHIENNVWIASSTIILAGVRIGENSVIGAGSVVTKSIPSNCVAIGSPAKVIKTI